MTPLVVAILFHGIALAPSHWVLMDITAYCPCARCTHPYTDGVTASGLPVTVNRGKLVSVPGYDDGRPVPVLDRGERIKGYRLDVLFPTHAEAKAWGIRRRLWVQVWKGKP